MVVGICGKSGSGKSTLSKKIVELSTNDVVYLDIDKIGHEALLVDEVKEELLSSFGNSIFENGYVNRKVLGDIVFNSRKEMKKLSDITWEYMQLKIDKALVDNQDKVVILDWILLYTTKYFKMCDIKILLDIPYEVRKERAMKRDNISEEKFDLREKASIDFDKTDFDFVIEKEDKDVLKRLVKLL